MNLYLVRHTRTALPAGVCYGRLDVPLAPGYAADIEITLAGIPTVAAVWTSTLERCLALARRLAARDRVRMIPDARLVELSFGAWEGKRWDEIDRAQSDPWASDHWDNAPSGGETAAALYARVTQVIAQIEDSRHAKVAVVTHGGPIRFALSYCLGLDPRRFSDTVIDFGAVLVLRRRCGRWRRD